MVEKGISGNNTYANHWTHCWDDVFGGVFLKLSEITDNALYKTIAEENLNYWMTSAPKTPGGVRYINSWGALRYTAAECMLAAVNYKYTNNKDCLNFLKGQIDYILGSNPRNSSYVVGFGNNYPKFPHYRAASGRYEWQPANEHKTQPERHLIYGALAGGPDANDEYKDDVEEYAYSEVAIDYNAGFVGAMAGMTQYFGGNSVAEDTPGIEDPNADVHYVDARIVEEDSKHITVSAFIHNETCLPPKFEKNLSFRYFVDLSEYYDIGLTVNDVKVDPNYTPFDGVVSQLKPWNEKAHIYYVEGSWPKTDIYGNVELQFAISYWNTDGWDSANDFSRNGLTKTKAKTKYIPIYKDGVKLFGEEPSKTALPTQKPEPSNEPDEIKGCELNYTVRSDWEEGATIEIKLTNTGSKPIKGWNLNWSFAGNQKIDSLWSADFTQTENKVTVTGKDHTVVIPAKGSVSFGFNMKYSGTNEKPTEFLLNGLPCVLE
jgi:endoglucanase